MKSFGCNPHGSHGRSQAIPLTHLNGNAHRRNGSAQALPLYHVAPAPVSLEVGEGRRPARLWLGIRRGIREPKPITPITFLAGRQNNSSPSRNKTCFSPAAHRRACLIGPAKSKLSSAVSYMTMFLPIFGNGYLTAAQIVSVNPTRESTVFSELFTKQT